MIVLGSSLFVALVITPVLLAVLMKIENNAPKTNQILKSFGAFLFVGLLLFFSGFKSLGNLSIIVSGLVLLNGFLFVPGTAWFQSKFLPKLEAGYQKFLSWVLQKKRPIWVIAGTFFTLLLSFVLTGFFPPKVLFFPENQPNYINVFVELPVGTNIAETNAATTAIKKEINRVLSLPISEKDTLSYLQVADVELLDNKTKTTTFVDLL